MQPQVHGNENLQDANRLSPFSGSEGHNVTTPEHDNTTKTNHPPREYGGKVHPCLSREDVVSDHLAKFGTFDKKKQKIMILRRVEGHQCY